MKRLVRESLDEEPYYIEYEEHEPEINMNGTKEWWLNDKLHREDGPAIEWADGSKEWWLNDKLHREDGPAVEWADGTKEWWLNNERQPDYFGKKPVRESLDEEPYVDYEEHDPEIDQAGNKYWYNEDRQLHREDGPAVIWTDGSKHWYLNNKLHREDGPAVEYGNGDKEWWVNGKHQPAYFGKKPVRESLIEEPYVDYEEHWPEIDDEGNKYWYNEDGELHREDGPAIEYVSGTKEWLINGELHREDEPAIEGADGSKFWYLNDKRHREDGPAIEYADGRKEWYLNGERQPDYFSKRLKK